MNKNRVVLRIAGMDYAIRGLEPEEYMHKLGIYVDKKMTEIMKNNVKLSTNMAAVLTALNVADDYAKAQENIERLMNDINGLKEEIQRIKAENERMRKENSDLASLNNNLQLKLVKTETELREARNSLEKLTKT
ncbi:MAG: cell division protein ZapA [Clostridiaceae bacterium]|nr:cell division protein ZapA [Clostridiaceae bacterium]